MNCRVCGKTLVQKRFSSGVLESPSMLNRRKYCNQKCMAKGQEKVRCDSLSHSRIKANKHIKEFCEGCGKPGRLHVHHKDGDPMNNTRSNLMTLCSSCHGRAHSPYYDETGQHRKPCEYCKKPSARVGLCQMHLGRLRRFGHPLAKKRKIGSEWILMLHDGNSWFPFPLLPDRPPEWDDCAAMAMPSTRK